MSKEFSSKIQLRWSDMDPNFHIRHSVYYDWGAQMRMAFLTGHGLTTQVMQDNLFGPVLFREEALFKKEVRYGDELHMDVLLSKLKSDYSRFGMRHHLWRGEELCAILNVEGAFINTQKRKITAPPQVGSEMIEAMQRTDDFEWYDKQEDIFTLNTIPGKAFQALTSWHLVGQSKESYLWPKLNI